MFPHLFLVYSLKRPHLRPCWAELLRSSTFWGVWAARSDHCLTSLLVTVGRWSLGSGTPAQLDHGRATDSFPGKAEQGWRKSDWVPESVFRAFPDPTLQLIPLLLKKVWKTGKQKGEEEAGGERRHYPPNSGSQDCPEAQLSCPWAPLASNKPPF